VSMLPTLQDYAGSSSRSAALMATSGSAAFPANCRSTRSRRRSAWARKRAHGVSGGVSGGYTPALMLAAHPDKASFVFSGISDAQWEVFVESVSDFVAEELMKGTWRVRRSTAPVASSCPDTRKRF
jgi:hypothetical protein